MCQVTEVIMALQTTLKNIKASELLQLLFSEILLIQRWILSAISKLNAVYNA